MPSARDQLIYQRQRKLQDQGWEFDTRNEHAVNPHSGHETDRHLLVKTAICNRIANRPGRFVTEAEHPDRGQADIIDLRPDEPAAVVIEVETDCTRERHIEKAMGICRQSFKHTLEFISDYSTSKADNDLRDIERTIKTIAKNDGGTASVHELMAETYKSKKELKRGIATLDEMDKVETVDVPATALQTDSEVKPT